MPASDVFIDGFAGSVLPICLRDLFIYLFTQKIEKDEPGIYSSLSLMTMG